MPSSPEKNPAYIRIVEGDGEIVLEFHGVPLDEHGAGFVALTPVNAHVFLACLFDAVRSLDAQRAAATAANPGVFD